MSYRSVLRKEHNVEELISSVNFEEEVFDKVNRDHFVKGLANYLRENRVSILDSRKKRSDAFDKAKKIYMGRLPPDIKKQQAKQLVKEAISNGYIWKFRLEQPWHVSAFNNENMVTTVPWQHKYAILYTGRRQYELWSKKWILEESNIVSHINSQGSTPDIDPRNLKDDLHNAVSILRQGYIEPGVRWASDPEDAQRRVYNFVEGNNPDHSRAWAIFFSVEFLKAKKYASGTGEEITRPVYEVEAPTNLLRVPYKNRSEGKMFVGRLEEYFEAFNSPESFIERLFDSGPPSEVQFHKNSKQNPNKYPVLPLDYVNGVWDLNVSNSPYFMPLKKYVKRLYSKAPERLPTTPDGEPDVNLSINADVGKHERQSHSDQKAKKADALRLIENKTEKLDSLLKSMASNFYELENNESLDVTELDRSRTFGYLVRQASSYDERLEFLESKVNDDRFAMSDLQKVDPLHLLASNEKEELEELIHGVSDEARGLRKEVLGQSHELSHKKKEELEQELKKNLRKLPVLTVNKQTMEELVEELAMNKSEAQEFRQKVKEKLG